MKRFASQLIPQVPLLLLALTIILVAVVPDEKIIRLKLMALKGGLFSVLFFGWLIMIGSGSLKIILHPLLVLVLAQALFVGALTIFAQDRAVAGMEFRRMLVCCGAFFTGLFFTPRTRQGKEILSMVWITAAGVASLYGILQHSGGWGFLQVPQMNRVMSTFGNPIFFGVYLALSLPLAWGLLGGGSSRFGKILALLVTSLGIWALGLSKTRASLAAAVFALLIFVVAMEQPRGWPWAKALLYRKKQVTACLLVFLAVHGILWFISGAYANAWRAFFTSSQQLLSRHQAHVLIWRDSLAIWQDHKLLGTGPGTFHIEFPTYASEELKRLWPARQFIVNYAHNEYLQTLVETGLLGLALLLGVIVLFGVSAWRSLKGEYHPFQAGLLASGTAVLVQNFFSVDMRFIISAGLLYLIMGLASAHGAKEKTVTVEPAAQTAMSVILLFLAWPVLGAIVEPYRAHQVVTSQPDFFEVTNPALVSDIAGFQAQVQAHPEGPKPYEEMAFRYAKLKDWDNAIINYKRALELNPSLYGAYNNLGNIHFMQGKRQESIHYYQESLKIKPDQIDAHLNLGKLYYTEGRLKEAAAEFQTVLTLSPQNEDATIMLKRLVE